jgi:hypothetical protein
VTDGAAPPRSPSFPHKRSPPDSAASLPADGARAYPVVAKLTPPPRSGGASRHPRARSR